MSDDEKQPSPEQQAQFVAKARRLMMIASLTTVIALGAVFAVIGYRVFHLQGSALPPTDISVTLPAGTKVLSSAIGDGRLVLTAEVDGGIELLSFDLATLKLVNRRPLGPKAVSPTGQ